ncbi:CRISPR-associated protein Cas4, partial [Leptospira interrogans serovar Pomona]|nr:CRISPR-associated protein Cas4 [Leptospira interrogans serovar Pomona]
MFLYIRVVEFPKEKPSFPIDYKNGLISKWTNQEAQLCAVAICLEEMFDVKIQFGAIYHIQS